jgi:phage minor structural protein
MIHVLDWQTSKIITTIEDGLYRADHQRNRKEFTETFVFEMSMSHEAAQYIGDMRRVVIPDEKEGQFREFIIKDVRKDSSGNSVEATCTAAFIEIAKQKTIEPITLQGQTLAQAATWMLAGTNIKLGRVDGTEIMDVPITEDTDPYSGMKQLATLFNKELVFYIDIPNNGNRIFRYADFLFRMGRDNKKEVTFAKDLKNIIRNESIGDIVTALKVVGPERSDGTRLELTVTDEEARQRWGWVDSNGNKNHLIVKWEAPDTNENTTLADLKIAGDKELAKRINAVVTWEAEAIALENSEGFEYEAAYLGDTIRIKDLHFSPPLYVEARIEEVTRSLLNNKRKEFVIGDFTEFIQDEVMRELQAVKNSITSFIPSPTPPPGNFFVIWIDTSNENLAIWKRWNGSQWVEDGVSGTNIDGTAYLEDLESAFVSKYSNADKKFYISQIKQPDYVGAVDPDDNNEGDGWAVPLRTINEAIRRIPKQYDGTCYLYVPYNGDFAEKIVFENITGNGKIILVGVSNTYRTKFTGRIEIRSCSVKFDIQFLNLFGTPEIGFLEGIIHVYNSSGLVQVKDCDFVGGSVDTSFGVCSDEGSKVIVERCFFYEVNRGMAAMPLSTITSRNNRGRPRNSGVYTYSGFVFLEGTIPRGITFAPDIEGNGQIFGEKTVHPDDLDLPTPTPPVAVQDKVATWKATGADSWRETFGGSWVSGELVQGKWDNWGVYRALSYAPSSLSTTLTGKTIVKMTIKLKRLAGSGVSGKVSIYIRPHAYASRPSGQPAYLGTWYKVDLYVNQAREVTLPTAFYSYFQSGQAKGIGMWYQSNDRAYYAKLDKNIEYEVTYR